MVSVPYKIPLPASPPPSPPRGLASTAALAGPATPPNNGASKSLVNPVPIPSPDVSHDDLNLSPQRVQRSTRRGSAQSPRLNDFELIRVLGKGCAGRVLLVKHTPTARVHAMKAISKRAVLANDELDHTLAEQRILRHFTARERRSAFVSRLYYSFCDKENFYLVMEFYPGGDLATQMEIHGILGPLRTRFYTCDIVAGLDALHREGILVRDLKPENILLNWHGHAVLADFGLSKSFGYRGDPIPVKLPADYIEGKGTPPFHAGKGFGSYRGGELTWDRAYSFVGTQEYLAPEVIKRNHYTYAIDWWALGCIVCECLTGRVPFRGHDDESNAELYERVVNAPWDAMYRGDHPRSYLKERYRIDSTTYDFIDGLLAKEPMFRLTEPCVKTHPYFTNVDWETVEKGDYQDPFQLEIDPVAEYNTQFFPRLCLEETPSVDMSGHDYGKEPDGEQNALNNDAIYAQAQLEFRKELESFEWTCSSSYWDDQDQTSENQSEYQSDGDAQEYVEASDSVEGVEGSHDVHDGIDEGIPEDEEMPQEDEEPQDEEVDEPMESDEPTGSEAPLSTAGETTEIAETVDIASSADHGAESVADTIPTIPSEASENQVESLKDPEPEAEEEGSELAYRLPTNKPASIKSTTPSVASTTRSSAAAGTPIRQPSSQSSLKTSSVKTASVRAPSIAPSLRAPSSRTPSIILPPPSDTLVERRPTVDSIPSVTVESIDSPMSPVTPSTLGIAPTTTEGQAPRLPSGPPQSGLSVSDVIAIPLRDGGSPNLIIRRHRQLPSIDRFNHARLSVELNGTFGQLGDEDWEQLDMNANEIPEAVNGANASGHSSFFSRGFGGVLGRRQGGRLVSIRSGRSTSSRVPSGLRKAVTSDSESGSEPTTTVGSTPSKMRQPLFASRGIENTKRAFTRIKAFPPSKRIGSNGSSRVSAASSSSPSPVASIRGVAPSASQRSLSIRDPSVQVEDWHRSITSTLSPSGKRGARADLPSFFSRPKARRAVTQSTLEVQRAGAPSRSSASDSTTTLESTTTAPPVASSSTPGSGTATPAVTTQIAGGLPRLELTTTAPIVWDLSLGSPGSTDAKR